MNDYNKNHVTRINTVILAEALLQSRLARSNCKTLPQATLRRKKTFQIKRKHRIRPNNKSRNKLNVNRFPGRK